MDPRTLPTTMGGSFRRHLPSYLWGGLMLGGFQLCMNRIDWMSRSAVDHTFGPTPRQAVQDVLYILLLAVVASVTRVKSRELIFNAGRDVEYELRALLLTRLHELGAAFYRRFSAGEIMSRATADIAQLRLLYGFVVLNLINVVFAFVSALQIMLRISPRLTAVALLPLPLVVLATRAFSRSMFTRMRQNQDSLGELTELVQSHLSGMRVVKSFALESLQEARFAEKNRRYLEATLALARLRGFMQPVLGTASALGLLAVFWYGGTLLLRGPAGGGISKGDFFAFTLSLQRMTWPIISLGFSMAIVQRSRAAFSRMQDVLNAQPEVPDVVAATPAPPGGGLEVRGLSLAYGSRRVLDDVSFTLPPGASLAVVGRTGSGKSTLAMLLSRLLPTPPQTVFLGGVDICELRLSELRARVGYAQQEPFLFSTTVARNIGLSLHDPEAPEALLRVNGAAAQAQVREEVLALPEQWDTVVGERGVQLSGGQKQRVALARALLRDAQVLVLDDPVSAVDARTESAILDCLDEVAARAGMSLLLITNRVAAAARCQRVLVLEAGRVLEEGTHEELVARGGLYAAFAEEQRLVQELAGIGPDDDVEDDDQAAGGAA